MYETMMEEMSIQAQDMMLHPLNPKPVNLNVEKEAYVQLLGQESVHKGLFGLHRELSSREKGEFSKKILQLEHETRSPFSMVLVATLKDRMKDSELIPQIRDKKQESLSSKQESLPSEPPRRQESPIFKESLNLKVESYLDLLRDRDVDSHLEKSLKEDVNLKNEKNKFASSFSHPGIDGSDGEVYKQEGEGTLVRERQRLSMVKEKSEAWKEEDALVYSFTPSSEEESSEGQEEDFRELVYELVKGIRILKGKNKIGLHLQLRLEQFGQMEVQLIMDEKRGIHIKFVVGDERTRSSILSGLNTLEGNLLGVGVNVKGIEVELRNDSRIEEDLPGFHLRQMELQDLAGRINLVA